MSFDVQKHVIKIKNGDKEVDYLPVQWRLVAFREAYPQGTISTEIVHLDLDRECSIQVKKWNKSTGRFEMITKTGIGMAIFKATVSTGLGGSATGTKSENAANFADYLEKAETGAIGRALAELGFGTQFVGVEFDECDRIVDAPVTR